MTLTELKGHTFSIELTPETTKQVIQILEANGFTKGWDWQTEMYINCYYDNTWEFHTHRGVATTCHLTASEFIASNS